MTTPKKLDLEKIFPELSQYRKSFSNGDRYKDLEGKKWIEFTFLLYLSGIFPDNPYSRISFTSLTPYEWKETKDMLVHLKWYIEHNIGNILFAHLKIVSWWKDWKSSNIIDTFEFFENNNFLTYLNLDDFFIEFPDERPMELIQQMLEEMAYVNFWSYSEYGSYKKTFITIESIFESYYRIYWRSFEVSQKDMKRYEDIEFMNTIILLFFSGFITIESIWWDADEINGKRRLYFTFGVQLSDSYIRLLEAKINQKDVIIKSMYDKNVTDFTVKKKWWNIHMLERDIEINWDQTRFVELQKKYPHSDIKAKNYKGKTTKYEVKEKIKLSEFEEE